MTCAVPTEFGLQGSRSDATRVPREDGCHSSVVWASALSFKGGERKVSEQVLHCKAL